MCDTITDYKELYQDTKTLLINHQYDEVEIDGMVHMFETIKVLQEFKKSIDGVEYQDVLTESQCNQILALIANDGHETVLMKVRSLLLGV